MVNDDGLTSERTRQLVPSALVEEATIDLFVDATPLLEEERYTAINALVADTGRPI